MLDAVAARDDDVRPSRPPAAATGCWPWRSQVLRAGTRPGPKGKPGSGQVRLTSFSSRPTALLRTPTCSVIFLTARSPRSASRPSRCTIVPSSAVAIVFFSVPSVPVKKEMVMSSPTSRVSRVLVVGPLAPSAEQYRERLKERATGGGRLFVWSASWRT